MPLAASATSATTLLLPSSVKTAAMNIQELGNDTGLKTAAPRTHISASVRRQVWLSCNSKCSRCRSFQALQIEHIKPWSKGGSNDVENLTLLCRNCNQRSAMEQFIRFEPALAARILAFLNSLLTVSFLLNEECFQSSRRWWDFKI
jgi:hypothetical protein